MVKEHAKESQERIKKDYEARILKLTQESTQ